MGDCSNGCRTQALRSPENRSRVFSAASSPAGSPDAARLFENSQASEVRLTCEPAVPVILARALANLTRLFSIWARNGKTTYLQVSMHDLPIMKVRESIEKIKDLRLRERIIQMN